ncbi:hypothetical protein SAMN05660464_1187 [Geodermatophilus dictyosporus]|uniref:Uncharacterized protein n=1 Tax=Geodermatophilus dictyosporus TaxID=1523247 RepID=A0A1I5K239_9ACTN|nr:hypothetical protein [Geodermatophilus dictyosporus]SFO78676.1 hypothetical protein SAMN05660464_1187 [Geodermatophilus dictyosporus]
MASEGESPEVRTRPADAPVEERLARGHRRLGEHLHAVEDHLLDIADHVLEPGGEAQATRERARGLSTAADHELARADELHGPAAPDR